MTKAEPTARGQRLSWAGYASMILEVQKLGENATARAVAGKIDARQETSRRILQRMCELGVLRVAGWAPNFCGKGPHVAVFALNDGRPSVDYPAQFKAINKPRSSPKHIKPELIGFCEAFKALMKGATSGAMCEASGAHEQTIRALVKHCRAIGLVHISGWIVTRGNGGPTRIFGIGNDKDKPRPAPRTPYEVNRDKWARIKARREADPFKTPADFESSVRQITVKATKRVAPPTNAVSSVWDWGKAA